MSKTRQAVIANLTFLVGQLEEIKSNLNDTMRYVKQNPETWDDSNEEDPHLASVSKKENDATQPSTQPD